MQPSDSKTCEKIIPNVKENDNKDLLSVTFSIESTCSKLKWWAILLICIGSVLALAVIATVIILTNKNLRNKVVPYRKRRTSKSFDDRVVRNKIYETKNTSASNPLYEN